ncbi:pantetheine-phosphate adenylyltransferase [Chryseobacterium sp. BIGb0186]|nr:pantetheine-phosphate adenylyltransferase [Chryseobacterium sp. BIGb0186]
MKIAVFPGSFDPITLGHYDIIERAAALFDKVIIAIGQNSQKKYMFPLEKRMEFIQNSVAEFPNVEVDHFEGLTVDYCFEKKCSVYFKRLKKSC